MLVRKANAEWNGTLKDGNGKMTTETGVLKDAKYTFGTRFESVPGTNPEELIGAAHAGCFSMAFAGNLVRAGFDPKNVKTEDKVHIEKVGDGFTITKIEVHTEAEVPDLDEQTFQELAEKTKDTCPVSRALTGTKFELHAKLKVLT